MSDSMKTSTPVLFVRRGDAKVAKTFLENESLLDKRFRMTPVVAVDHEASVAVAVGVAAGYSSCGDAGSACDDIDSVVMISLNATNAVNHDCSNIDGSTTSHSSNGNSIMGGCIAVPVTEECIEGLQKYSNSLTRKGRENADIDTQERDDKEPPALWLGSISNILQVIVGYGKYTCPFSTSILGNNKANRHRTTNAATSKNMKKKSKKMLQSKYGSVDTCSTTKSTLHGDDAPLTNVQYTLVETLTTWISNDENKNTENYYHNKADSNYVGNDTIHTSIETLVRKLNNQTCPKKLEIIGDDRTLVVPRWSLFVDSGNADSKTATPRYEKGSSEFCDLLGRVIREHNHLNGSADAELNENTAQNSSKEDSQTSSSECHINNVDDYTPIFHEIQSQLWENLAKSHNSSRVVRRGDIDPESGVRESGHRILWPILPKDEFIATDGGRNTVGDCNLGYLPTSTGPGSPGWITVTEHKIRQSFDLTRVMFSRGNVTEKKRFGISCVQPGEDVLDMYAGIGYYTLPALIHGKARHVTACEWNTNAFYALKHNLKANRVDDKVTVLEGDCRLQLKELLENSNSGEFNHQFDRISLGLLPSSEGGWAIAVLCLRQSTGGWLHVHGNVPTVEREKWTHWLCRSLSDIAADRVGDGGSLSNDAWIAVCTHVEKVKSFAPKVDHVVADVFLGPSNSPKMPKLTKDDKETIFSETGMIGQTGEFMPTPLGTPPPSCALSDEGILNQNWMRESA